MTIILAEPGDAAEILALQKLAYQSEAELYQNWIIPPLQQTQKELAQELSRVVCLKYIDGQRIVGSVRAELIGDTCFIGRLIVHPEAQNRGLGSRLMVAIQARFPGAKRFELFTGHRSLKNLHLYRKLGFSEFKRQKIDQRLTMVFLEKVAESNQ